jgi:hypothetical protein
MLFAVILIVWLQILTIGLVIYFMSTTGSGLSALQAEMTQLQTDVGKLIGDIKTLIANQQPGLQPGQVIVNQSDIDALTATASSIDSSVTAEDQSVAPPTTTTPTA